MKLRPATLAFALPLVAFACSEAEPAPAPERSASAISGGTQDTTHTSVVAMVHLANQGAGLCTGTLILPNLVLTAHHCVAPSAGEYVICGQSEFGAPYAASELYITTNSRAWTQTGPWYTGAEIYLPPGGNDTCGFDVALLRLETSVPTSVAPPYIPRIDRDPVGGENYLAVGFGATGQWDQGGTRMQLGNLKVQCSPEECFYEVFGIRLTEWLGDRGICQGDSGGPALDDQGRIIGVVSRGGQDCSTPIYGSVSRWKDWIMTSAADAAAKGGIAAPEWVQTGCSDPTCGQGTGGAGGAGGSGAGGSGAGAAGGAAGTGGAAGGGTAGAGFVGDPQSQACAAGNRCPGGYLCVDPGDGSGNYCSATCATSAECPADFSCLAGDGVCFPRAAASAEEDGGCRFDASGPVKPVPWEPGVALLGGLALAARRRNTRRAQGREG